MNANLFRRLNRSLMGWLSRRWRWVSLAIAAFAGVILYGVVAFSQQPVQLTMLTSALDAAQERHIVEAFEAEHPNIRINVVEGPNASNLIEDLYTSSFLLGDSPYDLVMMDIVWLPKFAAAGWLMDLSDRVPESTLEDFLPVTVEGSRFEDKLYRMPVRTDVGMLYYREDLLEQIGAQPPETFSELLNISEQLQESGEVDYGFVWQGRQYEGLATVFVEVLEGTGGFWIDPDTLEVGLDRPETVDAIDFLRTTVAQGVSPSGVTTYQEEEARRLFQSGDAAFMRNWPYALPLAEAEDSVIQNLVGIKTMVHEPNEDSGGCLGGWGIGISNTTTHPDEAFLFAEYYASEEAQRSLAFENGYLPTRRSLYTDPQLVEKYSYFPDMLDVVQEAVLRPQVAQYAQASDILQRYLSAALTGRMTPEDAMQSAADETRTLLRRYTDT